MKSNTIIILFYCLVFGFFWLYLETNGIGYASTALCCLMIAEILRFYQGNKKNNNG